jgi:hypothetical protein
MDQELNMQQMLQQIHSREKVLTASEQQFNAEKEALISQEADLNKRQLAFETQVRAFERYIARVTFTDSEQFQSVKQGIGSCLRKNVLMTPSAPKTVRFATAVEEFPSVIMDEAPAFSGDEDYEEETSEDSLERPTVADLYAPDNYPSPYLKHHS